MPRHLDHEFDGFMIGEVHFMALRFYKFEIREGLIEVASTGVRSGTFWEDRSEPLKLEEVRHLNPFMIEASYYEYS